MKDKRTQGAVPCVLTKHSNKHHGARSKSLPAPCSSTKNLKPGLKTETQGTVPCVDRRLGLE